MANNNVASTRGMQLVDDTEAQAMAAACGLCFESCCWDAAVTASTPTATLVMGTQKLPVLKRFNDACTFGTCFDHAGCTVDILVQYLPTRDFTVTAGNEAAAPLTALSLATYLRDVYKYTSLKNSMFLDGKDECVVVRTQACLLPVDNGRATRFHVGFRCDTAAALVLLCTEKGTSAHVVHRGEAALYVNDHGTRRTLVAEVDTKARTFVTIVHIPITETKTLPPETTAPCTPFFNPFLPEGPQNRRTRPAPPSPTVPELGPRHPDYWPCVPHCDPAAPRYTPTTPAYIPGMSLVDPAPPSYVPTAPAYEPTSPVPAASAFVPAEKRPSPVYDPPRRIEAPLTLVRPSVVLPNVIAANYASSPAYYATGPFSGATTIAGVVVGAFPSLGDCAMERDGASPIRVTVQFYHLTTNGAVTAAFIHDMAERMRSCETLAM